jgi:hypothetical protein
VRYPAEAVGNLHIHSRHSDGAGTIAQIARAARRAGVDFIVLNDHDYLSQTLHSEEEGFYSGLLALVGLEIGTRHHHYLAYDLRSFVRGSGLPPQEVIDRVSGQGGFGFLAHPFEKGMPFLERSTAYTWEDLTVRGYRGICIWNFMSRWKERIKGPLHGLYCVLFKSLSLQGPSPETLSFWDRVCGERRVVAIGGSDAHGSAVSLGGFRFTPVSYDFLMGSVNVHLLLERPLSKDLDAARAQVYEAMREGRLFVAHDALAASRGFRMVFTGDSGLRLEMGEEAAFEPGVIEASSPGACAFRLIADGSCIHEVRGLRARFPVARGGVYRMELYRRMPLFGWRPWIFTNPVYLRQP